MNKIREPSWILGRGADGELRFEDDTVSRRHARLAVDAEGRWTLEDLDSSNGSWRLDAGVWTRIHHVQIGLDDALRLGEWETSLRDLLERFDSVILLADLPLSDDFLRRFAVESPVNSPMNSPIDPPALDKPRRNPGTGQIEESD